MTVFWIAVIACLTHVTEHFNGLYHGMQASHVSRVGLFVLARIVSVIMIAVSYYPQRGSLYADVAQKFSRDGIRVASRNVALVAATGVASFFAYDRLASLNSTTPFPIKIATQAIVARGLQGVHDLRATDVMAIVLFVVCASLFSTG